MSELRTVYLKNDQKVDVNFDNVTYVKHEKNGRQIHLVTEAFLDCEPEGYEPKKVVKAENVDLSRLTKAGLIEYAHKRGILIDPDLKKDDMIGQIYEGLGN